MRRNRTRILAWGLCLLAFSGSVLQLVGWIPRLTAAPSLEDASDHLIVGLAIPVVYSVLAALIIARQPGNIVGWLMMVVGLSLGALSPMLGLVLDPHNTAPEVLTPGLWLAIWVNGWSWVPFIFSIFLIPLFFPTGSPPTPRWRSVAWLALAQWVAFLALSAFSSEMEYADWTVANPIGAYDSRLWEGPLLMVWGILLLVNVSGSVASLFVRYRRAAIAERQQIRWLLLVGAGFVIIYAAAFFTAGGFAENALVEIALLLSILAFPAAIAVAIFRYRLWDLDVVINRALIYGPLTTVLAGMFAVVIALTTELTKQALGDQSKALGAAVSALIVSVFFQPLRSRIEKFVDARFYPQKLDLASGLVEVQAPYWGFLNESILMRRSMEHVRRVMGTRHAAYFRATASGGFELNQRLDEGTAAVRSLDLSEKQRLELGKGRVIEEPGGGPLVNHAPIFVDRGKTNELLGLLSIGARDNGKGYSGDDLRGLAELGGRIGLALNALQLGLSARERRG